MSGHTPGPWKIIGLESSGYGDPRFVTNEIECADGRVVASVVHDSFDEHLCNANLIAAAPCLLEALELLTTAAEYGSATGSDALRKAQAAIARAKGES